MPTFVDRTHMVQLLRGEYDAIGALCSRLSKDDWDVATCLPGWTVRDALSHVIGTEAALCGEPSPDVGISHLGHIRNPIAEANEIWVESMRHCNGQEMLARFEDVTGRRLSALDAMTQPDFDAPSWTPAGRDETYGRFMRIRHFDCFMHEHDIRGAVGAPWRDAEDDVRSALDEVATGIGYIVGRRAALPEGTTVRIDLTGPVNRTYLVEVEGRATIVDSLEQPVTAGISLSAMLFLRLTGGRDEGPIAGEGITFSGDRSLGDQLVANLAFTI
ncbi:MAG: maleylpyruvate isomerase family mycothiol-dependent enzyme [Acidimicrobiales bacterium]